MITNISFDFSLITLVRLRLTSEATLVTLIHPQRNYKTIFRVIHGH